VPASTARGIEWNLFGLLMLRGLGHVLLSAFLGARLFNPRAPDGGSWLGAAICSEKATRKGRVGSASTAKLSLSRTKRTSTIGGGYKKLA
jgi:hypothetical protein